MKVRVAPSMPEVMQIPRPDTFEVGGISANEHGVWLHDPDDTIIGYFGPGYYVFRVTDG